MVDSEETAKAFVGLIGTERTDNPRMPVRALYVTPDNDFYITFEENEQEAITLALPEGFELHYKKVNGELPGAELLQRTMTIPTMANLLGIREATAYELIHRLHFRSVKTEYSSQRLLIDKATFYEWLKSQTHYKIVEGKEDFYDREELSEAQ